MGFSLILPGEKASRISLLNFNRLIRGYFKISRAEKLKRSMDIILI